VVAGERGLRGGRVAETLGAAALFFTFFFFGAPAAGGAPFAAGGAGPLSSAGAGGGEGAELVEGVKEPVTGGGTRERLTTAGGGAVATGPDGSGGPGMNGALVDAPDMVDIATGVTGVKVALWPLDAGVAANEP